jgi:hypothetical protein
LEKLLDSNITTTLQLRIKLYKFRKYSRLHEKDYQLTKEISNFERTLSLSDGISLDYKQINECSLILKKIKKYINIHPIENENQNNTFETPLKNLRKKIKYHLTGIELHYILKDFKNILNEFKAENTILEEFNRIDQYCKFMREKEIKKQNLDEIKNTIKRWEENMEYLMR